MSSFKGSDLFGSGPHLFSPGPVGQDIVPRLRLGIPASGSISVGDAQLAVTIRGRLVADDDAGLWDQIDAIESELAVWATPGSLIDSAGHEWPSINFVRFEPDGAFDRGRKVSVAYTALFIQL